MNDLWEDWRKTGIIPSNEKLLEMMQDLVDVYEKLNKINKSYYMMVCDRIIMEWHSLRSIACARDLKDYPEPESFRVLTNQGKQVIKPRAEPDIVVNGIHLNAAQAMSVRVAVTSFRWDLANPERRKDLGPIGDAYDARLAEVEQIMLKE